VVVVVVIHRVHLVSGGSGGGRWWCRFNRISVELLVQLILVEVVEVVILQPSHKLVVLVEKELLY
jgi:hypothetical protein